jgi:type VI protein secretion system component Hcp
VPTKKRKKASRDVRTLAAKPVSAKKAGHVTGGKLSAATPKLHEAACKGTHLPEVVIEVW